MKKYRLLTPFGRVIILKAKNRENLNSKLGKYGKEECSINEISEKEK